MIAPRMEEREKLRKSTARKAVALAMGNRWADAVKANLALVREFPDDLEAYNRLGKALSELGRNREAREAFQRALEISPYNVIARKNLTRLTELGDEAPPVKGPGGRSPRVFIEERGKTCVTSLEDLPAPKVLLKMAPGHPARVRLDGGALEVTDSDGEYLGRAEPRLATRLIKLIKGGNRYEAVVTRVGAQELMVIIREIYRDPSQAELVSFPSKGSEGHRVYMPSTIFGYDLSEEAAKRANPVVVKDWSNDDTEPGDGDAFSPAVHRMIDTASGRGGNEDV